MNATTSVKEGMIEAGGEFNWELNTVGNSLLIRPTVRMPLTSKSDNSLQLDRFSSDWRGVISLQYNHDYTTLDGSVLRRSINGQFEYGSSQFKYYPTGVKTNEFKSTNTSYSAEIKYISFRSKGKEEAWQFSPQLRLRYSSEYKAGDLLGIVQSANQNGVVTTQDLIIDAPAGIAKFSPAFSLQIYPGQGSFSYSPSIYHDFTSKKNSRDPFNNLGRLRLESWVFFYPSIDNQPNVKIGISPFLSIRTMGSDNFNKVEFGGMLSVKFGTTFLQFF